MSLVQIVFAAIQLVLAISLITIILFQHGRDSRLSGTIAGGAETFFGRNRGRSIDFKLSRWTKISAVIFVLLTLLLDIMEIYK